MSKATIRDRVVFERRRVVRYETAPTDEHAGGTLTMAIETPGPGALLLRFIYETTMPAVDDSGDDRYAEIVKSAYHEADLDTVRKIRELLYNQGFTISGARNRLDEGAPVESAAVEVPEAGKIPGGLRNELQSIIEMLRL